MDIIKKVKIRLYIYKTRVKLFLPKILFRARLKHILFDFSEIDQNIVIYIMCGKSTVNEAIATYFSIQRFHDKYFNVIILDDGTLNKSNENQLMRCIKSLSIIYKKEADELFNKFILENPQFHNLSEIRDNLIFGPRLIDIHLVASGRFVLQLDTDVLFLNRPEFLLNAISVPEPKHLFNLDVNNSYSGELNEIYLKSNIAILEKFNGGLTLYKSNIDELKFYSNMIELDVPKIDFYYWEQTLFALMMTKNNAMPLPDEYDLHYRFKGYNSLDVPSRHYCGDSRVHYYFDYFKKVQKCSSFPLTQRIRKNIN